MTQVKEVFVQYLPNYPKDAPEMAYANPGDAGFDLRASLPSEEPIGLHPGETKIIPAGFKIAVPEGFELQVRSRSGLAAKNSVHVLNGPGTVDSGYRGEVGVILHNAGTQSFSIRNGDRIAQGVLSEVPRARFTKVDSLEDTERGSGGFGSTGVS